MTQKKADEVTQRSWLGGQAGLRKEECAAREKLVADWLLQGEMRARDLTLGQDGKGRPGSMFCYLGDRQVRRVCPETSDGSFSAATTPVRINSSGRVDMLDVSRMYHERRQRLEYHLADVAG